MRRMLATSASTAVPARADGTVRITRAFRAACVALATSCATAAAGGGDMPRIGAADLALHPDGAPTEVRRADVDGDGRVDLAFVSGRVVSLFVQRAPAAPGAAEAAAAPFSSEPTQRIELSDDAVFVDVGDAEDDGALEIFVMTASGVNVHRLRDGRYVTAEALAVDAGPLALHEVSASDLMWNDFLLDLDGRGGEDLVLPAEDGYRLMRRAPDGRGFTPFGRILSRPRGTVSLGGASDLGSLEQTLEMPRIFVGNVAGDARPEVILFDGREVHAFAAPSDEDGTWTPVLDRVLYSDDETLAERLLSSRNVRVDDLDGDGRASVLVVRSPEHEIDFFATEGDETLADRRTLRLDGWILPPKLADLDGDGRIDLLAPVIDEIGPIRLLRIFATRSFSMRYAIFRNKEDVRYARTPDEVREISFPLRYETGDRGLRVENAMIYTFDGDFDGDGRRDLVIKNDDTSLAVYAGRDAASFGKEPIGRIDIPDADAFLSTVPYAADLNADGRADLVLHYRARSGGQDAWRVYLSGAP